MHHITEIYISPLSLSVWGTIPHPSRIGETFLIYRQPGSYKVLRKPSFSVSSIEPRSFTRITRVMIERHT